MEAQLYPIVIAEFSSSAFKKRVLKKNYCIRCVYVYVSTCVCVCVCVCVCACVHVPTHACRYPDTRIVCLNSLYLELYAFCEPSSWNQTWVLTENILSRLMKKYLNSRELTIYLFRLIGSISIARPES